MCVLEISGLLHRLRTTRVSLQLKKYGAGKGAWAVVTGASEGIGREYALQLAKKGFNVLVMARNKAALNALVNEIGECLITDINTASHFCTESVTVSGKKMQALALPMDFSNLDDASQWNAFQAAVENLDVGVLGMYYRVCSEHHTESTSVNNVGKSHTFPSDFVDAPASEVDNILAININSVLKVTRVLLPGMIQRYFPWCVAYDSY